MSSGKRAYDILRGYVNHGWDRLQGSEQNTAEAELREALEQPLGRPMRQTPESNPETASRPIASISVEAARRLLDVPATATSKQIKAAHDGLRTKLDASRFPAGSEAQERSRHLCFMIDAAQRVLIDNLDPTIKRFEDLQVE
jgi:hypothetical protein